jgi:hypothetical protein
LPAVPDAKHACKHPDHSADCAAQHATHRPSRLVTGFRSLLDTLDQPLRICGKRRVEKHDDNCPKRDAQSQPGTHWRCRPVHSLLSINFDMLAGCFWKAAGILPGKDIIVFTPSESTCRAVSSRLEKLDERAS